MERRESITRKAVEIIKWANRVGEDITEAIENAIEFMKDNWDEEWGTFPENNLRNQFSDVAKEEKTIEVIQRATLPDDQIREGLKKVGYADDEITQLINEAKNITPKKEETHEFLKEQVIKHVQKKGAFIMPVSKKLADAMKVKKHSMPYKLKKWQIGVAVAIFILIITNPSINRFKEYTGMVGKYSFTITRPYNFLIFSIYQNKIGNKKYIGVLMNFIPIN